MKQIIVSGIQPSGKLHIGNYVGAIQQWLKLQDDPTYDCFFFIADYHSLSGSYDPAEKRQQILDLVMDLLALGVDPQKCTMFVQSHVAEHTELCWVFNTVTPMSFLERMTQYKDKSAHQAENINAALFDYPVLMAADILMYNPAFVPVGDDQVQHVELARDVAGFFNNKFGETFALPKVLLTTAPRLKSLADSAKKMSKSHGEKTYIGVFDEPEVIAEKMKRAVTDEEGVKNLLGLFPLFGGDASKDYTGNNAALKEDLAAVISEYFREARERRRALVADPGEVVRLLEHGAAKARAVASATMDGVRRKIGVR
jgi:tryptophanyl-tRNA synthetase